MGWYLRKSFKFGPLRVNLSKSGLGYSFGIRGARIGTGPRGNYIHLGRHGIYYRQYFTAPPGAPPGPTPVSDTFSSPFAEIRSAGALQLHESSADAIIAEIKEKRAKVAWAPTLLLICTFVLVMGFVERWPSWLLAVLAACAGLAYPVLAVHDRVRKTVRLQYRLEEEAKREHTVLIEALSALGSANRLWRVLREERVLDPKYSAGAGKLVGKNPAPVRQALPKWVATESEVWELILGRQRFYFFPDRILVIEAGVIGAVGYDELQVEVEDINFVEQSGVPPDSEVIGQTWRYSNKDGSPDRRFANNPPIPLVKYGEVTIRSAQGLNVLLQVSCPSKARKFASGLQHYAQMKRLEFPR